MELTLKTPVQYLPRVGPAMAARLGILHIHTIEDLLYHIPFRYNDFSLISSISQVQPGETVTIHGTIDVIRGFYTKTGKKIQEAKVTDDTGSLKVIWFNQPYLLKMLKEGDRVSLSGQIAWFGHTIVMNSPQFEIDSDTASGKPSLHTGRLVPVYPETEGVTSKWLRGRIAYILDTAPGLLCEFLPNDVVASASLMSLRDAIKTIHFPDSTPDAQRARHRLCFDELFTIQLQSQMDRIMWEKNKHAPKFSIEVADYESFVASLPFTLTTDQQATSEAIVRDLSRSIPMRRLLVGDVGSGKTVVAALAMYCAFRNGFDSVLMAPTEILATQHYKTITQFLSPLGIRVGLVTGSSKINPDDIQNTDQLVFNDMIKLKSCHVLVGTHALLSDGVPPKKLGLVVIDEQHRFGVVQREKLLQKSPDAVTPHLLTMTATPIPRTIARTMFGSLDVSILNELPMGRKKIKTWVVPGQKRTDAYHWITRELSAGGQAFFIYPLIDESENLAMVKAVTTEFTRVKKLFPNVSVGLLHGRLKPQEKNTVLDDFRNNTIQLLVTTPVVEVGIDVPNATIMLVESADRFGLGQLHQLRGRVGRGDKQSYCLLFTEQDNELTLKRLKALETIYSGPQLAEVDLTLRGPGEVFGTRQHGIPTLRIASFLDSATMNQAHDAAKALLSDDSSLSSFPLLRETLKTRTIGDNTED